MFSETHCSSVAKSLKKNIFRFIWNFMIDFRTNLRQESWFIIMFIILADVKYKLVLQASRPGSAALTTVCASSEVCTIKESSFKPSLGMRFTMHGIIYFFLV